MFPQFATHNAHTIAAIAVLAGNRDYEFQRLFGMGEALQPRGDTAGGPGKPWPHLRAVGGHKDLLAYLVRRLLRTAPNTSFVNRLADDKAPIAAIITDPWRRRRGSSPRPIR